MTQSTDSLPYQSSNRLPAASRFRWWICLLLFFATTINYADRQILSLLKPILDQELKWTNEQFGYVNAAFQFAYALSYLAFGFLIDRFGTKLGYAVSIAAWSLAAAAHALANSVMGFGIARVLLGTGEGGNFPAAIKAVAEWFPKRERAMATALFNSGANVGALIAPAIVPPLAAAIGWHGVFVVAGVSGFVWLIFWMLFFDHPTKSRRVSEAELVHITSDADEAFATSNIPWLSLLKYRQTWGYLAARFLTDPVWWFFLIWLPDYFKKTRGMDMKTMGKPLILTYAIVTVLAIFGTWAAKRMSGAGASINRTRKLSMLVFACCVFPVFFVSKADLWTACVLLGIAGGAHQAWSASLFSTVGDQYPKSAVASMVGLGGLIGSTGGIIFPIVSGKVLDIFGAAGYTSLFAFCGCAYLLAFGINHVFSPRFEPITLSPRR